MATVLLLTNTLGASAEVLPALGLLQHSVKILPAEASVLVDVPDMQVLLIDARRDLPAAKSLTKLLTTTGVGAPVIAITTESTNRRIVIDWILRPIESSAEANGLPSVTDSITFENSFTKAPWPRADIRRIEVSGDSPAERASVNASIIAGKSDSIDSR